jgi:hypothetical protein
VGSGTGTPVAQGAPATPQSVPDTTFDAFNPPPASPAQAQPQGRFVPESATFQERLARSQAGTGPLTRLINFVPFESGAGVLPSAAPPSAERSPEQLAFEQQVAQAQAEGISSPPPSSFDGFAGIRNPEPGDIDFTGDSGLSPEAFAEQQNFFNNLTLDDLLISPELQIVPQDGLIPIDEAAVLPEITRQFDPPTPAPAPPPPPPPQTAEQRRQDDILVQLGRLGSNLNRVQAAEERRQQRQTRDEIPNLGQNTPNPLAQVPESVIATLLNLGEQNNLGGGVQVAERESKRFPNVPDRRPTGRLDRLRQEQAEKARLREAFGRNPTGFETLRFNNPTFDKILRGFGVDPLFIGNQTRVIDGRLTPVPVRRRAEGGRVAPPPMPRPRPKGLAATPEGEESFSFGFSLDDVNDYVNRVLSGDIVSENLRNMFSSGGGEEKKVTEEVEITSSPNSLVEDLATTIKSYEGPAILKARKPVKGDPFTIGFGRTRDLEGNPITEGTTTTEEESNIMLQEDIALRLPEIRRAYPNFDSYPRDLQVQIGQSYYRGTLTPGHSPKTRKLINQGKFKEAAKEFLDNEEYRTAKQRGRSGIRDRMEDVAKALRNYESRSS